MEVQFLFLFLLFIVATNALFIHPETEEQQGARDVVKLELIHRHHHPELIGNACKTRLERIKDLNYRDRLRYDRIVSQRLIRQRKKSRRRNDLENSNAIEMPMHSGADFGNAEYFVRVKVGTPAQKFTLVADSGSELTWMNCRYGGRTVDWNKERLVRNRRRRVFQADRSSSFKTVPCISDMCKVELMNLFSLTTCPTPITPCAYQYGYIDGSTAIGIFANETVTVGLTNGRKTKLHNTLIGCTKTARGDSFKGADGVLGIGYGKYSFVTTAANQLSGGKLSYCLVDHLSPRNVSNYLTFGATRKKKSTLLRNLRYTKLQVGGIISPFYGVTLKGISIGGVMLRIPSEVWNFDVGGGTILDTGTSLTFLPMPAYKPTVAALSISYLSKFKRLSLTPFDFCFNSTGFDEHMVPRLRFHFADGARFQPLVKSYVIDTAPQIKCLGFVSVNWPATSIIGNIMQQNHLWEFDLVKSTVGFGPSRCI